MASRNSLRAASVAAAAALLLLLPVLLRTGPLCSAATQVQSEQLADGVAAVTLEEVVLTFVAVVCLPETSASAAVDDWVGQPEYRLWAIELDALMAATGRRWWWLRWL